MSGPRITDAAVEAGARALASDADDEAVWPEYDREAVLVITAALPHIRRAVIEELVAEAQAGRDSEDMDDAVMADYAALWLGLRAELEGDDRA